MVEIWHNPRCSKSRAALAALEAAGVGAQQGLTVRRYLEDAPDADRIRTVLGMLGLEPWEIARDAEAREEGVVLPREPAHREAWIAALAAHPRILQRPILIGEDTATLARDPASLDRFLDTAR